MHNPLDVYHNPEAYKQFLTAADDKDFEGQLFDRKEAGRLINGHVDLKPVRTHIVETVSAFANRNREGGLLVLGISKTGQILGLSHLSDAERTALTKHADDRLRNHFSESKFVHLEDAQGVLQEVCFIYTYYSRDVCETADSNKEAWERTGARNRQCDADDKDRLRREKKVINYEVQPSCPFDPSELDRDVIDEFRRHFFPDADYEYTDEQLLYKAGAIVKHDGELYFTTAGYLFFTSYPQRLYASAYIRLLRFGVNSDDPTRGTDTLDKSFRGSLVKQIRDIRAYILSSGLFQVFRVPRQDGGFIEQDEFPFAAVDEAIVNAVVHRDYAMNDVIRCEYFKDALIVQNMGRILQPSQDIPDNFNLNDFKLSPYRRNEKIVEWFRCFRDDKGAEFVKSYGEGTQRMLDAMQGYELPPPQYAQLPTQTRVTLYSNAAERSLLTKLASKATEYTNLYKLTYSDGEAGSIVSGDDIQYKDVLASLRDSLNAKGWFIDNSNYSELLAHKQGQESALSSQVRDFIRFYPAYIFQIKRFGKSSYLCIDYKLEVRSIVRLSQLPEAFPKGELLGKRAMALLRGWTECRINSINERYCRVYFYDYNQEELVPTESVIPKLTVSQMKLILQMMGHKFDLSQAIKNASLALDSDASRKRAERTQTVANEAASVIFPLKVQNVIISLSGEPASLKRHTSQQEAFSTNTLAEPKVEFSHQYETSDISTGITTYGSYDTTPKDIEIVPLCLTPHRDEMSKLIERLKAGKYKYKGSERTFHTRFSYQTIVTYSNVESALAECKRLLNENPQWAGNNKVDRIFLVHVPVSQFSLDDENSPYYRIKRFLFENGIPCQMVDTKTLRNPDFKDLNLALNMAAKCGVTPWVLPEPIPDVDAFIGLSYTGGRRDAERQMGYANVFTKYGRWQFYASNSETFPYDERSRYLGLLAENTLGKLAARGLSETAHIHFHYSDRFSRVDRNAILEAARKIRPLGTYSFVWISSQHNVRLFDSRAQTDGSLSRGSFVVASDHRIYLSTTGYNSYRKTLGTPVMLQIDMLTECPPDQQAYRPDLKALAVQILSLTKLNWASTSALIAEPITTNYAGRIAYLTAAFLRQGEGVFRLHPALENVPWFL